MKATAFKAFVVLLGPLVLTGCVTGDLAVALDPSAGFETVALRTGAVTGKDAIWVQSSDEARATASRVQALVRQKTVTADIAVQVALLNNRGLQASYAEIGLSGADVWQESLLVNPTVSVSLLGTSIAQTLEATVASNILALATRSRRMAVADTRFRQNQLRAAEETLRLAADTRRAWIEAVVARERVAYLNQAEAAADAASELAQKLGETGAFTKTGQAREHVFYAELAGQTAEARLAARLAKEGLNRLMGLWGGDIDYSLPSSLPALPRIVKNPAIEADALRHRVDLEVARLELEALAKSYNLTGDTRYVSDLELLAGVEVNRDTEVEDGRKSHDVSGAPRVELAFAIPIFDTGEAKLRKVELSYMQAANRLAERAVNIRSEARSAYDRYRSTYDIARHYRSSVVPLRTKIESESVLTYNGMITNTFELLADTRAKINSILLSLNAKREFWLADVDLGTAIHGGGEGASSAGAPQVAGAEASGGH